MKEDENKKISEEAKKEEQFNNDFLKLNNDIENYKNKLIKY